MWVRGLKLRYFVVGCFLMESHPMWVRGLKHPLIRILMSGTVSHPMWVRGLKLNIVTFTDRLRKVAPHVGAWIETICTKKT